MDGGSPEAHFGDGWSQQRMKWKMRCGGSLLAGWLRKWRWQWEVGNLYSCFSPLITVGLSDPAHFSIAPVLPSWPPPSLLSLALIHPLVPFFFFFFKGLCCLQGSVSGIYLLWTNIYSINRSNSVHLAARLFKTVNSTVNILIDIVSRVIQQSKME